MAEKANITDWVAFVKERIDVSGIEDVHVDDVSASSGGLSAQIVRLTIRAAESSKSLILKRTKPDALAGSLAMGIAREAEFFSHFASLVDPQNTFVPKVFYSAVEFDGYKVVLMEDLKQRNGAQAGYFYGSNSLLNWGKDLTELTKHFAGVSEHEITVRAFQQAAVLHARFWGDTTLLARKYLRAAEWMQGENKALFDSTAKYALDSWAAFTKSQEEKPTVTIQPEIVRLVESTAAKIDFAKYAEMWKSKPWTMVHGDYHPANMMLVDGVIHPNFDLMLLDWEAVGVGSGPQDLGQFMISHSTPEKRRESEKAALDVYEKTLNEALVARGEAPVSKEYILQEYVEGGLCRWAWLLPVCASLCPPQGTQYFHDQMYAFLKDHNVNPEDMGMMRP